MPWSMFCCWMARTTYSPFSSFTASERVSGVVAPGRTLSRSCTASVCKEVFIQDVSFLGSTMQTCPVDCTTHHVMHRLGNAVLSLQVHPSREKYRSLPYTHRQLLDLERMKRCRAHHHLKKRRPSAVICGIWRWTRLISSPFPPFRSPSFGSLSLKQTWVRLSSPVEMRSSRRPGVPTTILTPFLSISICSFAATPPITSNSLQKTR
ncbi:unnamed protein product [Ixodes pacificus]